jgi:hypothetical protein
MVQDVGFWEGTRVRQAPLAAADGIAASRYEFALAPDIDLKATGEMISAGPHYPSGRAIVVGMPPGIR